MCIHKNVIAMSIISYNNGACKHPTETQPYCPSILVIGLYKIVIEPIKLIIMQFGASSSFNPLSPKSHYSGFVIKFIINIKSCACLVLWTWNKDHSILHELPSNPYKTYCNGVIITQKWVIPCQINQKISWPLLIFNRIGTNVGCIEKLCHTQF